MSLRDFLRRARFWVQRDRLADELDEEMRLHVALRARANRERGMAPADAALAAKRQFGNRLSLREAGRDAWGFLSLERLVQDVRYAIRQLTKHRGVTAVAVLTLALGIGANVALFSAINAVLLKPARAADPGRLVWVMQETGRTGRLRRLSYPAYALTHVHAGVFEGVAAFTGRALSLGGASPERVQAVITSDNYFDVLGIQPQLGRFFAPDDALDKTRGPVAVVSDSFWRQRFGADPRVVDRPIVLNSHHFTIIGVAPRGFVGLQIPDGPRPAFWIGLNAAPIAMPGQPDLLTSPREAWLLAFGRLKPDVTIARAVSAMSTLAASFPKTFVEERERRSATVLPIKGGLEPDERDEVGSVLWLLMIVPALVLMVACANVANLLLARGVARRKELALRRAIGATRWRLVRQLLTESAMLSVLGGVLSVAVAIGFIRLIGLLGDVPPALIEQMTPDQRVFFTTMAMAVGSVLIFGLTPAFAATSHSVAPSLKDDAGVVDVRTGRRRLRSAFVIGQISVSLALLITAGLFLQSLGKALKVDPGFDTRHALTFSYDLSLQGYLPARQAEFHRTLLERVRGVPGVQSAALAAPLPLSSFTFGDEIHVEGSAPDSPGFPIHYASVSTGFLQTLGVNLLRGRDFNSADTGIALPVAIVTETFARLVAPGGDVLGKRFRFGDSPGVWRTVVGLARDSKYDNLTDDPQPFVFLPITQRGQTWMSVLVRLRGDPAIVSPLVVKEVHALDADLPVYSVSTLEQNVRQTVDLQRAASSLLAVFGGLALFLAALGIYGVTAHGVTLRTREIGIRMSLGARAPQVLRLFISDGLRLSIIGVGIGLVLSTLAAGVLEAFLFGLHAVDAVTFVGAAALLCGVAVVASYIPARRAARVDPLIALRHE